jgi:hypothetical protein
MIKKLISFNDTMALKLEELTKEHKTTQSRVIESALMIYILMNAGSKQTTNKINNIVSEHQDIIFKDLDKITKKD